MPLERELETFTRELPRLRATEPGRFVLVKDDHLDSVWDTWADAVQAGRQRFGLEPFLVKRVPVPEGSASHLPGACWSCPT